MWVEFVDSGWVKKIYTGVRGTEGAGRGRRSEKKEDATDNWDRKTCKTSNIITTPLVPSEKQTFFKVLLSSCNKWGLISHFTNNVKLIAQLAGMIGMYTVGCSMEQDTP